MDSTEYKDKIKLMLTDERVYQKLKKDPTQGYKRWMVSLLTQLKNKDKIMQDQYYHLYHKSDMVPRLYGSPNIHKDVSLLCPIVKYTGSMAYNTSKAISDLLKPFIGKTKYHVKRSWTPSMWGPCSWMSPSNRPCLSQRRGLNWTTPSVSAPTDWQLTSCHCWNLCCLPHISNSTAAFINKSSAHRWAALWWWRWPICTWGLGG